MRFIYSNNYKGISIMSIIYSSNNNGYKNYKCVIKDKHTVVVVSSMKYGDISLYLDKLTIKDRVYTVKDIDKIYSSGKYTIKRHRFKRIIELENELADKYSNYVVIRVDINPDNKVIYNRIVKRCFLKIINRLDKTKSKYGLTEVIIARCYCIENSVRDKKHAHLHLLLDGNKYISNKEALNRDIEKIKKMIVYLIKTSKGEVSNSTVNIIGLSKGNDKISTIINKNDYIHRNCAIEWMCYICKEEKISKYYPKEDTYDYNNKLFNVKVYDDMIPNGDWYSNRETLITTKDTVIFRRLEPSMYINYQRLKSIFDFEDGLFKISDDYILLPYIYTVEGLTNDVIFLSFMERLNIVRFANDIIKYNYLGRCYSLNVSDNNIVSYMYLAIKNSDNVRSIIDYLNGLFRTWIARFSGENKYTFTTPNVDEYCDNVVYIDDIKKRNEIRVKLARLSMYNEDTSDFLSRRENVRFYGKSLITKHINTVRQTD